MDDAQEMLGLPPAASRAIALVLVSALVVTGRTRASQVVTPSVSEEARARLDADRDARRDVSRLLWCGCGCALPIVSVFIGVFARKNPPRSRLEGKSDVYVRAYTETYRAVAGGIRYRSATAGSVAALVLTVGIPLLVAALASGK